MRDEMDSRIWVDNHERFTGDLAKAARHFWHGLQRLNARKFDAPWHAKSREC